MPTERHSGLIPDHPARNDPDAVVLLSRRELKSYYRRSNRVGLVRLSGFCTLLTGTGLLVYLARDHVLLLVATMFVHGVVLVHLFALQHECSHFTAFRSRRLCRLLMRFCGFVLIIPPLFFRYEHADHHTHTNIPGDDPELIELPRSFSAYLFYLTALPYWQSQVGGLLRRARGYLTADEKRFVPAGERPRVIAEGRWMLGGYLVVGAASVVFGWSAPLIYWWLPMLFGEPVMRYIRMTEHVARPTVPDARVNTRSNRVVRPLGYIAWNMHLHAEHHYAPSVPFHALPRLHKRLEGNLAVEPGGYLGAHRAIRASMRAARVANVR